VRIGIDLACWANHRGYGRYARELTRALVRVAPEHEFTLLLDPASASTCDLTGPNVHQVVVRQDVAPTEAARADGARSLADMLRFTQALWRARPDVFFSPSVYTYFPIPPRQRAVVAIHDAIAERFPELTLPSRRARLFWHWKVRLAIRQARLVLTVSDFARDELVRFLGVPEGRIRVSGEAPADAYRPSESPEAVRTVARRAGVPDGARWFAYVGGFNPHKHVDVLVRAHAIVARAVPNPPHLVLVGATSEAFHGAVETVREAVRVADTAALVHWAGYVADEDLRHLLSGALALVLPSECEGFGLPAVEAAACGTPVVATTQSPLPSLLAGGGTFVPPRDEHQLASAMRELASNEAERKAMGARARAAAGALTWDAAARNTLSALREAAA
jgi:glycosyltransferase involved in cell wall biosynthesis